MDLPTGCELHYLIGDEAWYAEANKPTNPDPYLSVMAQYPGDGCEWEFEITEHDYNGGCVKVKMFSDSFAAFAEIPEFFDALTDLSPASLSGVVAILDELGAKDATPRVDPYA